MAKSNTIQFKGTFDGSQILNELKKVRASMSEAGASDTLFKNVDKDIVATEKLVNDMMAQIQKGFSNTKEITAFEKQINKLQTNFLKISTGLKGANLSENFTFNSPEIAKLTQEINRLTAAQDRLKESSKNALVTAGHNIGFNQDDVKEIQKAIDANEDLEESLVRVAKAKEKAAKANAGQTGMATDAGKKYIADAKAGLSLEDLGATAMSGKTAKGPGDARARGAGGKLKRGSKGVRLDEDKAMAAVNETYQQALEETVRNGGSAVDAVEAMKKALADYGVQLSNTERLQENFAESLEGFYTGDIVGVGQKSAVTKAQKAGKTNAQGEFELSDDARRQVVNNSQITAYNQNLERTAQAERELATERERLAERAEQAQEEYNNSLKNTDRNVEEVTNSLREQAKATKDNSASQERMNEGFDNMKSAVKTFLSISSAVNGLKSVIRSTFEDIKNLDKSFAEIAMVTDYSVGEMWESYGQYSEMAIKLGQSTQGVIQASGLFYQQGLNTVESLALTEDTMKLATLAGTDFSEATSQMTAALRGFKMEMDEGNRVTDVYSELAAKAAADVQGIAYAMSKTASIAESAGMEFETTSAFLTQMIETTQEAPENIGTAMKTIIARFTELKENVAGTDKSEFDDLDYNKVDIALKSVGVSLKDANGQFRDLDDVFLELSGKWDTLDRNTQRYIATIAAGSRQQSRFIAMMDNYDRTIELVDTAYDSAGKSSEQFAKYQDTLEYKLNKLQGTWEAFRTRFFNSEFFKNIITGLTNILDKIQNLDFGQLITIGAIFLTLGKTAIQNFIRGIQESATGITKAFEVLATKGKNIFSKVLNKFNPFISIQLSEGQALARIEGLKSRLQQLETERIDLIMNSTDAEVDINRVQQQLDALQADASQPITLTVNNGNLYAGNQQIKGIQGIQGNAEELNKNLKNTYATNQALGDIEKNKQAAQLRGQAIGQAFSMGITSAITAYTMKENPGDVFISTMIPVLTSAIPMVASVFTTMGFTASAALTATGVGALIVGIGLAIGGIAAGIKAMSDNVKEQELKAENSSQLLSAKKNIKALTEAQEELEQATSEANAALSEQKSQYELLSKNEEKLKEYQSTIALTSEEQEDYLNISNEIAESFPTLIDYYDEQGNAILKMGEAWETAKLQQQGYYAEAQKEADKAQLTEDLSNLYLIENQQQEKEARYENAKKYGEQIKALTTMSSLENAYATDLAYEWTGKEYRFENSWENAGRQGYGFNIASQNTANQATLLNAILGYKDNLEGDPDKVVEAKEVADLIKTIMADQGYSDFSGDITDKEVFKKFQNAIDDNTTLAREYQEALSKGLEAFYQNGDAANALNDELLKAKDTVNEGLKNMLSGDLMKNEEYIDASLNVQEIIKAGIVEEQDFDIDQIREQWKADEDSTYSIYRNDAGNLISTEEDAIIKEMEALIDWYSTSEEYQIIIEEKMKNYDTATQEVIDTYYENIKDLNAKERIAEIQKLDISQSVKTDMIAAEKDNIESYNTQLENLSNLLNFELSTDKNGLKQIFDLDFASIENFSENFKTSLEKAIQDIPIEHRGAFQKSFRQLFSDLQMSQSEVNALFSIDWSTVNFSNENDFKEQIANTFEEATGESFSQNRLDYLFDNIQDFAKEYGIIDLSLNIPETEYSEIKEKLKGLSETKDIYLSAISESLEEGFLSFETINTLEETLGDKFNEIVSIGENGLATLNIDTLNENFIDLLTEQKLINDKIYQEKTTRLEVLQTIREELKSLGKVAKAQDVINALSRDHNLTAQDAYSMFGYDIFEQDLKQIDDLIKKENEELEEYKNQFDLTDLEINTLWAEYYSSYSDSMNKTTEETKDNTEALKEWQETLYGTAEWLDEQDPFKTLAESISLLEKKLEGLKTDLEEVTDPQQTKDLLNDITKNRSTQIENLTAQKQMSQMQYDESADFMKNGEYKQYFSQLPDGTFSFDIEQWYTQGGSDEIGDVLGEMATKANDAALKLVETDQQIQNIYKEQEKEHEERVKNYASLQEQIIDILKQNAEEEIKTQKEKYDALKEADNDYLSALEEAIEKQRKLREQENEYEDLAQKEKKLALMQRDTSGTNQKEVNELQKEVEEQRQELLDNKVDEMIDKLKQQTELQTEIRDMEIEIKENELESKNYLAELAAVESSFHNADDVVAWMLENNKELEDMSIEQQEAKILEWEELGSQWAAYLGEKEVGYTDLLTTTEDNINSFVENGSAAIEGSIQRIITNEQAAQAQRELDAQKALNEAQENHDKAIDLFEDYWRTVANQNKEDNKDNKDNKVLTGVARDEAYKTIKNEITNRNNKLTKSVEEGGYGLTGTAYSEATKSLKNEFLNKYSNNKDIVEEAWSNVMGGTYSPKIKEKKDNKSKSQKTAETEGVATAVAQAQKTINPNFLTPKEQQNKVEQILENTGKGYYSSLGEVPGQGQYEIQVGNKKYFIKSNWGNDYQKLLDLWAILNDESLSLVKVISHSHRDGSQREFDITKYATGGLVNYTGPAWVDGTPSKPEAFLSAQDTERIGNAAKLLADLPILNSTSNANNAVSSNIGDTSIEIHINVESLASDYDVDQMIERVKNDILDVSKPAGTSVILHK